jgi:hypothetical protein
MVDFHSKWRTHLQASAGITNCNILPTIPIVTEHDTGY